MLIAFDIMLSISVVELRNQKEQLIDALYTVSELKECPMCNATVKLHGEESFYIKCDKYDDRQGCGLQTGYYSSKEELIEQWNAILR